MATGDAGYVLVRAPETIRIRDLVAELLRGGDGHVDLEGLLALDAPLQDTLSKIEAGLREGFGDLTLADMVAAVSRESAPQPA